MLLVKTNSRHKETGRFFLGGASLKHSLLFQTQASYVIKEPTIPSGGFYVHAIGAEKLHPLAV